MYENMVDPKLYYLATRKHKKEFEKLQTDHVQLKKAFELSKNKKQK